MTQRFAQKVALATGSTQGVGEALLHLMADEGLVGAVVTGHNTERGTAVLSGTIIDLDQSLQGAGDPPMPPEEFGP